LKFQGKRAFLKRKHKAPVDNNIVVKQSDNFTIAKCTRHHIISVASPNTDVAGEDELEEKKVCVAFSFRFSEDQILNCTLS